MNRSTAISFVLLLAMGCGGDKSHEATDTPATAPSSAPAPSRLASAVAAFMATASGTAESRRESFGKFLSQYDDPVAGSASEREQLKSLAHPTAREILKRIRALDDEGRKERAALGTRPEKPEKPSYAGAFHLSGSIKKCYQDGIVVRGRGKYFFVKDAQCPNLRRVNGYVESDLMGTTIDVDIGRDGREAEVVTLSDRETAQDDREVFNDEIIPDYRKELRRYTDWDKIHGDEEREHKLNSLSRGAAKQTLEAALERILAPMAGGAQPPSVNVEMLLAQHKRASKVDAKTAKKRRPKKAPAARKPPPSSRPAKAEAPAPRSRASRTACLKRCIAKCDEDSDCERTCASQRCK